MSEDRAALPGRGTAANPPNRFERSWYEVDPELADVDETPAPTTQFFHDSSRTIIATNDSPDIPFDASINPYRGCEHGCIYCYARPTHEYLGYSAGLDFESKILVKHDAPELLRRALAAPSWRPKLIALSGVTDPYQPIERRLKLTRSCLEVLAAFRNPVTVVTKNRLVTRDVDVLADLASDQAAMVFLSVTTLDSELARRLEPRASTPAARLAAIEAVAKAGVPTGVMVAPVIPGLTDHELPSILGAASRAGAQFAGYVALRLPFGVSALFDRWLSEHFPAKRDRVLHRIRELREGELNDPRFGSRMRGTGAFADVIKQLFETGRRKAGLNLRGPSLSTAAFRRPGETQRRLFE